MTVKAELRGLWVPMCGYKCVVLALLVSLLPSCAVTSTASLEPAATVAVLDGAELRISALVNEWFAVLEADTGEPHDLDALVSEQPFEFSFVGTTVRSLGELAAWRVEQHSSDFRVEYEIDSIRIESTEKDVRRAHFEIERRISMSGEIPRIARREHTWLIRDVVGTAPAILRIHERPLLAFPGTGPQVVCY